MVPRGRKVQQSDSRSRRQSQQRSRMVWEFLQSLVYWPRGKNFIRFWLLRSRKNVFFLSQKQFVLISTQAGQRQLEELKNEIKRRKKMIKDVGYNGNRNILVDKLLEVRRVQKDN